ncbi:MAG TPA: hypothetical protein VFD70_22985 [Anaerolineae bacterium]|nr:hypothetical protein [Anaerolineae bacterium]
MRFVFPKSLGMILLAIYLILFGLQSFISIGQLGQLLALLAIAAGVLILLGR